MLPRMTLPRHSSLLSKKANSFIPAGSRSAGERSTKQKPILGSEAEAEISEERQPSTVQTGVVPRCALRRRFGLLLGKPTIRGAHGSADAQHLVGLQAELPSRSLEADLNGDTRIRRCLRSIHGLE